MNESQPAASSHQPAARRTRSWDPRWLRFCSTMQVMAPASYAYFRANACSAIMPGAHSLQIKGRRKIVLDSPDQVAAEASGGAAFDDVTAPAEPEAHASATAAEAAPAGAQASGSSSSSSSSKDPPVVCKADPPVAEEAAAKEDDSTATIADDSPLQLLLLTPENLQKRINQIPQD